MLQLQYDRQSIFKCKMITWISYMVIISLLFMLIFIKYTVCIFFVIKKS